jgi:hypothetical protein
MGFDKPSTLSCPSVRVFSWRQLGLTDPSVAVVNKISRTTNIGTGDENIFLT